MARIVYWNIENFSFNKVMAAGAEAPFATSRRNYIVRNVLRGEAGHPPDIIVVVEIYARIGDMSAEGKTLGSLSRSAQAVRRLLSAIRHDIVLGAGGSNWRMVPPLILGEYYQSECVAVFYNATTVQFTGPNLLIPWQGAVNVPQSQPVTAITNAARITYPVGWQSVLPTALGRTTNFAGIIIPEAELAGEWQYYVGARPIPSAPPPWNYPPGRITFPNQGCRGPFYTRFLDLATGNTINLYSVHTSPATADAAIVEFGQIPALTAPPPPGEINVFLGDFNVDTFEAGVLQAGGTYHWLIANNYRVGLDPRVPLGGGAFGPVNLLRKPYCVTHILRTGDATPFNTTAAFPPDLQHNVYPRFGYVSSSGAIDNIFVRYAAGLVVPANNICIINTITGKPYSHVPAPAAVTPELFGGPVIPTHIIPNFLYAPIPPALPAVMHGSGIDPGAAGAGAADILFSTWPVYDGVRSTSDHLAVMIDV